MVEVLRASEAKYTDSRKDKLTAADKLFRKFHASAIISALGISKGGLYNRAIRNKKNEAWYHVWHDKVSGLVLQVYQESGGIYGADRIAAVLRRRGVKTSSKYVGELMHELGIRGVENKKRRRVPIKTSRTISRLIRQFDAYEPNVLWVTDFTELKINEDSKDIFYLCVYLDIYSRMIVGHAFSSVADTTFVKRALSKSLENRGHPKYLLVHSDQGSQYTSVEFQDATDELGIVRSFSRPGKPADNPVAEAFFSVLKREECNLRNYDSIPDMKRAIEKYIDWYNNERVHSALQYMSPKEFEKKRPKNPTTRTSGL